jgi:hypothetical protein
MYTGTGGQIAFGVGASLAGGKSIVVLPASALNAGKRLSRITPSLPPATVFTLPRAFVHYVVTEYGVATLIGKSLRERAPRTDAVAHRISAANWRPRRAGATRLDQRLTQPHPDDRVKSGARCSSNPATPSAVRTYRALNDSKVSFSRPTRLTSSVRPPQATQGATRAFLGFLLGRNCSGRSPTAVQGLIPIGIYTTSPYRVRHPSQ